MNRIKKPNKKSIMIMMMMNKIRERKKGEICRKRERESNKMNFIF